MALNYALEIEESLEPQNALQFLAASHPALQEEEGYVCGPGVRIVAYREDDRENQLLTRESFGFLPSLIVDFRINPQQGIEGPERIAIGAAISLLCKVPGRAVLLFNYENPILQKKDESFILSQAKCDPWVLEEIDKAQISCHRSSQP